MTPTLHHVPGHSRDGAAKVNTEPRQTRRPIFLTKLALGLALGLLPGLLLTTPSASWAQIYKVTEGDSVEFTDRPQTAPKKGRTVEEVDLPQLNTAPGTPVDARSSALPSADTSEIATPATVTITAPENEFTVAMGPGNYTVNAETTPALGNNEALLLLIDGAPHGDPQRSATWQIEGSMRGPKDLRVQRLTFDGVTVAESDVVRIYVLRPSVIGR